MSKFGRIVLLLLLPLGIVSCVIVNSRSATLHSVTKTPQRISSPVKAYLRNGAIVAFRTGAELRNDTLWASGTALGLRYEFPDSLGADVRYLLLDSILALEAVQLRTNEGASIAGTLVGSAVATVGAAALFWVIFGSCPTVYSDSAGTRVLDAEIFANRISALFEARDLDLLKAQPNDNGVIRLEVRNEALETHYINVFELLETSHTGDETVVLDERGKPIAIKGTVPPARAVDAQSRDVTAELTATDGNEFMTSMASLRDASLTDLVDHIDLTFANERSAETALTMRLRNSVLNSVLLYDVIMNQQGLHAVDWLGVYMERIGSAVEFARWHHQRFGLRVSIRRNGKYEQIARHPTYGPIAWRDVATILPGVDEDSLHVRLSFIKDDWRIDRAVLARSARRLSVKRIAADRVAHADGSLNENAVKSLRQPDQNYVQTYPGHRFFVEFDVAPQVPGTRRTWLLASHGFYTEWVRGAWLRQANPRGTFHPTDTAIVQSLERWRARRETLTKDFFAHRVPVM